MCTSVLTLPNIYDLRILELTNWHPHHFGLLPQIYICMMENDNILHLLNRNRGDLIDLVDIQSEDRSIQSVRKVLNSVSDGCSTTAAAIAEVLIVMADANSIAMRINRQQQILQRLLTDNGEPSEEFIKDMISDMLHPLDELIKAIGKGKEILGRWNPPSKQLLTDLQHQAAAADTGGILCQPLPTEERPFTLSDGGQHNSETIDQSSLQAVDTQHPVQIGDTGKSVTSDAVMYDASPAERETGRDEGGVSTCDERLHNTNHQVSAPLVSPLPNVDTIQSRFASTAEREMNQTLRRREDHSDRVRGGVAKRARDTQVANNENNEGVRIEVNAERVTDQATPDHESANNEGVRIAVNAERVTERVADQTTPDEEVRIAAYSERVADQTPDHEAGNEEGVRKEDHSAHKRDGVAKRARDTQVTNNVETVDERSSSFSVAERRNSGTKLIAVRKEDEPIGFILLSEAMPVRTKGARTTHLIYKEVTKGPNKYIDHSSWVRTQNKWTGVMKRKERLRYPVYRTADNRMTEKDIAGTLYNLITRYKDVAAASSVLERTSNEWNETKIGIGNERNVTYLDYFHDLVGEIQNTDGRLAFNS